MRDMIYPQCNIPSYNNLSTKYKNQDTLERKKREKIILFLKKTSVLVDRNDSLKRRHHRGDKGGWWMLSIGSKEECHER